jgi:formate hydrogenlyase subunit 3/multisubunit Na+/H+ antiporter MnhD subunit
LVSNGVPMIGFYILVRYGFVIDGSAIAPWWGVALLLAGAVSVLLGSVGALAEVALMRVLASARAAQNGMVAIGLGIALLARAVDDPALAVIAAEASLLGLAAPVLFMPLLELGAGRVMEATGTGSLDWLGGLMRGMPRLGGLMLWGSAGLAAVPLSPGFAPLFLLLHAAIGAAGTFGLIAALGFLLLLGLLGLCAGLLLMAAIRIIGIGFLGRPRSLRAAAAEEAELPVLLSMGLLALCSIPLALAPGMVLGALQPVIGLLVPSALALPVLGYAPLPLLLLLLALAGFAFLLLRRFGAHGARSVAPWHGGLGPPPAWLPFGDPLTQPSATGFSQPLRGMLALDAAPWRTQLVSRMPRPLRRRIVVLTVAFRRMSQAQ